MFVASNLIGSTIQITTLPLPVLSTLQASGLVFNTAFATLLLKEPFTRYSLIGTILTCAGAALIATFGAVAEPAHSLTQLLVLLRRWNFIVWMVGTMLIAVLGILVAHFLKIWSSHRHLENHVHKHERPRSASASSATAPGVKRSFTASLPKPLQIRVTRLRLGQGLCYGLISGILSAHSLLVAKSAVELIVRTIVDRVNQFNRFQSWLILVALLFFALTQLYYLHLGLRLCSTSVLYPFVFCVYNIIAILDGLIYFKQASRLTALHAGLTALGTLILLSGVFALSWRLDDTTPEEAAHAAVPPATPLTPGMGMMRSSEDEERPDPLLPTTRSRSGTASSRKSADEQTPLLNRRRRSRGPTLTIQAPESNARDIWAELDDDAETGDILASLPHAPSPFLTTRKARRGDSVSSQAISSTSRRSSSDSGPSNQKRKSSLMRTVSGGSQGKHGRKRSTSVHFADDDQEAKASRFEAAKDKLGSRDKDEERKDGHG